MSPGVSDSRMRRLVLPNRRSPKSTGLEVSSPAGGRLTRSGLLPPTVMRGRSRRFAPVPRGGIEQPVTGGQPPLRKLPLYVDNEIVGQLVFTADPTPSTRLPSSMAMARYVDGAVDALIVPLKPAAPIARPFCIRCRMR